jgi:hypothetical protein
MIQFGYIALYLISKFACQTVVSTESIPVIPNLFELKNLMSIMAGIYAGRFYPT